MELYITGMLLFLAITLIVAFLIRNRVPADPDDPDSILKEADTYLAYGKPDDARAVLRQGLQKNPGHGGIMSKLNALR